MDSELILIFLRFLQSSDNNASLSDTDEEPANKLARVSSSSIKSQGSNHNDTLNNVSARH